MYKHRWVAVWITVAIFLMSWTISTQENPSGVVNESFTQRTHDNTLQVPRPPIPPINDIIRSFASVPRDANEYARMFKLDLSKIGASKANEIDRSYTAAKNLEGTGRLQILHGDASQLTAADEFLNNYQSGHYSSLVLIGHNDGGVFQFPDESYFYLNSLPVNKTTTLAILSCKSSSYSSDYAGVPSRLTYSIAFRTNEIYSNKVYQYFSTMGQHTLDLVTAQDLLSSSYQQARLEKGARYAGPPTIVIFGGGTIYLSVTD